MRVTGGSVLLSSNPYLFGNDVINRGNVFTTNGRRTFFDGFVDTALPEVNGALCGGTFNTIYAYIVGDPSGNFPTTSTIDFQLLARRDIGLIVIWSMKQQVMVTQTGILYTVNQNAI